ncbi:MAG TPA: hypothetical protein ENI23_04745 [bacterium]|nr:hypothetical protein [bacterium]
MGEHSRLCTCYNSTVSTLLVFCFMKKNEEKNDSDLVSELVRTGFKLRYHNSVLGFLWVLLKPFFTFLVLFFVFNNFKSNDGIVNFPIYLLSGIILFTYISESLTYGLNALLEKSNIILKVNFDRTLAVYSSSALAFINFAINLAILAVFAYFNPVSPTLVSFLYMAFVVITTVLGLLAASFFLSIFLIRLRDLSNIVELLLQLLFYGSAIFYPVTLLPQKLEVIMGYNPFYIIIESFRTALILGEVVLLNQMIVIFVLSVAMLMLGKLYFKAKVKKIAEYF